MLESPPPKSWRRIQRSTGLWRRAYAPMHRPGFLIDIKRPMEAPLPKKSSPSRIACAAARIPSPTVWNRWPVSLLMDQVI